MPTWLKVILVIFAIGAVLLVVAGVVAYRWVQDNRSHLVSVRDEGAAYGRGREANHCIDEGLRRLAAAPGFQGELNARLFVGGCLSAASRPPAFCEAVPRQSEIIAAAEWTVNECRSRNAADIPRCSRVLQEVVTACDRSRMPGR